MSTAVSSENFSITKLWKANATAQIISASISFLASLLIVASTGKSFLSENHKHEETDSTRERRSQNKITSPYRRIIFLISASDILHSLAWITGPFMVRSSSPQALWAVSDSNTACVVNGFFFTFGASTSFLYYVTLCYFYYCKISKRMTDEQFTRRYEKKIHFTIAFVCVAGSCLSIFAKTYNSTLIGTFCTITNTPAGCKQQPEIYGECDQEVEKFIWIILYTYFVIVTFSFSVIMYSMIRLIHSVSKKDRQYGDLPSSPTSEQLHIFNVRKQLLRETMIQAIMYTSSLFICQSALFASFFLVNKKETFPAAFQIYNAAIVPLNSAVNVFIFTRPAVRHVRRVDPSITRFRAFWMVLQAGGEAPNMDQSSSLTNEQRQQQPHLDMSSREPFGYYYYYGNDLCASLDCVNDASAVDVRIAISTLSGQDKTRGLEGGALRFYDRPVFDGKNVDILERSGRIICEDDVAGDNISHTFTGQVDEGNVVERKIDSNSGIHGLKEEVGLFGQKENKNEYRHYDVNMLESSDNAAGQ